MIAPLEQGIPAYRAFFSNGLSPIVHLHRHVEMVLLLEGTAVAHADTQRCPMSAGDIFLAFPNQVHYYESSGSKVLVLVVEPDLMPELSHSFMNTIPESALLSGAVTDELLMIAKRLTQLKHASSFLEKAERHGLLLSLFSRVLSLCTLSDSHVSGSTAFRAVLDYCSLHYTSDISLASLEQALHVNRYYISHMFSDKLQIGFNDYINSLRIAQACRYLKQENLSVTEISARSGFSNPRTFNRVFLKQIGVTPSEYRKRKE